MPFPYTARSVNGIPIRLTEERWYHITKHHPELKGIRPLVLRTISFPQLLFYSASTSDLAAVAELPELAQLRLAPNLVVHYKEISNRDGFIVTAFPISKVRMHLRFKNWQRLK